MANVIIKDDKQKQRCTINGLRRKVVPYVKIEDDIKEYCPSISATIEIVIDEYNKKALPLIYTYDIPDSLLRNVEIEEVKEMIIDMCMNNLTYQLIPHIKILGTTATIIILDLDNNPIELSYNYDEN